MNRNAFEKLTATITIPFPNRNISRKGSRSFWRWSRLVAGKGKRLRHRQIADKTDLKRVKLRLSTEVKSVAGQSWRRENPFAKIGLVKNLRFVTARFDDTDLAGQ